MKRKPLQTIDKQLNEVHSLLSRLIECPQGYSLSKKDLDDLDTAEETLNDARSALWRLVDDAPTRRS